MRDRAGLATDDRAPLRERLEAVTGVRISALEAVGPERAKTPETVPEAGHGREREGRAAEPRGRPPEPDRARERRGTGMET